MMPKVNMVTPRHVLIWSLINHIVVVNSFCGNLYPKQRQNGAPLRNSLLNPRHRGTQLIIHATASDDGGRRLDELLETNNLKAATNQLKINASSIEMTKDRMLGVFDAIEERTINAEENDINKRTSDQTQINLGAMEYPPISPARMEMTEMYTALKNTGNLEVYGAASDGNYPALGSKQVSPNMLEKITDLSMVSLTPQPTNSLLFAGGALAVLEGIVSLTTGINLNFLVFFTLFLAFLDKLLVNGAVFETAVRLSNREYSKKILKHEAGHFLCAYLLGCPVEGYVLSSWAALSDPRFGGRRTTVSAGTSFFDPDLSDEINGRRPLSRSSIDRYSIIVMGGIAAEALNFGRADGGAGDESALVAFLGNLNPRGGAAVTWDIGSIKNQARWGALQAVLLLREYKVCYDALVDALERGGTLGECVYAIETAAKENGMPSIREKPLGYILDKGLEGEWITSLPSSNETNDIKKISENSVGSSDESSFENDVVSLEELKKQMKDRLQDIESKLDSL